MQYKEADILTSFLDFGLCITNLTYFIHHTVGFIAINFVCYSRNFRRFVNISFNWQIFKFSVLRTHAEFIFASGYVGNTSPYAIFLILLSVFFFSHRAFDFLNRASSFHLENRCEFRNCMFDLGQKHFCVWKMIEMGVILIRQCYIDIYCENFKLLSKTFLFSGRRPDWVQYIFQTRRKSLKIANCYWSELITYMIIETSSWNFHVILRRGYILPHHF